jgi:hypothetical protein
MRKSVVEIEDRFRIEFPGEVSQQSCFSRSARSTQPNHPWNSHGLFQLFKGTLPIAIELFRYFKGWYLTRSAKTMSEV